MLKTPYVPHFSTSGIWVSGANTDLDALFECHGICVQTDLVSEMVQMEICSHMGRETGQGGFEMLASLFSSSFVILRREKGPKRTNLLEFR